jgi:hypothetical protein
VFNTETANDTCCHPLLWPALCGRAKQTRVYLFPHTLARTAMDAVPCAFLELQFPRRKIDDSYRFSAARSGTPKIVGR